MHQKISSVECIWHKHAIWHFPARDNSGFNFSAANFTVFHLCLQLLCLTIIICTQIHNFILHVWNGKTAFNRRLKILLSRNKSIISCRHLSFSFCKKLYRHCFIIRKFSSSPPYNTPFYPKPIKMRSYNRILLLVTTFQYIKKRSPGFLREILNLQLDFIQSDISW